MNLVKDLNNAAIWNIKLLNIESQIFDAESGIPPGMLVLSIGISQHSFIIAILRGGDSI